MDFLFEIGLEEVPARMIASAQAELQRRVAGLLERERLVAGAVDAESYSTPRRLSVLVRGVAERQEDLSEEVLGPALKIAFPQGREAGPGPAAIAFAKKSGVEVSALKIVETPKGEYVAATSVKPGKPASEVIAAELPKELAGIYWAKNMYWRPGKPERFVRPVRWLLALLGDAVVPVEFGGYSAGRVTYGHRVLFGAAPIHVASPESYLGQLSDSFVMADAALRRHTIRKALDRVCRSLPDTRWREDHALVDKMTHLTEWPSVIAGSFEPEYLELPEEVLVTVMRDHQNYFAVETEDGKLAPNFLAVLNTVADEAGQAVIRHGNERVLRARFNDARFFWEFDQRVSLEERVALLENVTFHAKLFAQGSYAQKVKRLEALATDLVHRPESQWQSAPVIGGLDEASLKRAIHLSKSDLTTEMVKEFTELQGQIGGLYAAFRGESNATSRAIYDQYRPQFSGDRIPATTEGAVLSIADRADTIGGLFAIGLAPTGSKDPFALRRAANGIVQILVESPATLDRSLSFIARRACLGYGSAIHVWKAPEVRGDDAMENSVERVSMEVHPLNQDELSERVREFLVERLDFYLREVKGVEYDVVRAVLAVGSDDVRDAVERARAISTVRATENFTAISIAFKRMKNILQQAADRNDGIISFEPEFDTEYEREFWRAVQNIGAGFLSDCRNRNYQEALLKLSRLRTPIDNYFADTMVMVDDLHIRANRLGMLRYLVVTFRQIADFSEIVVAG